MKLIEKWYVYIVKCHNKAYYTGITKDVTKRLREHNFGKGGKYTRAFGPVKLVWKEEQPSRSDALKRESEIKKWTHAEKEKLFFIR